MGGRHSVPVPRDLVGGDRTFACAVVAAALTPLTRFGRVVLPE